MIAVAACVAAQPYAGRTKAIAYSRVDLGTYGCAARDLNPEPAD
jgi:hypothetical protein